jgi:hypothetical protein
MIETIGSPTIKCLPILPWKQFVHIIQDDIDVERVPTLGRGQKSQAVLPRLVVNGILSNQVYYHFDSIQFKKGGGWGQEWEI